MTAPKIPAVLLIAGLALSAALIRSVQADPIQPAEDAATPSGASSGVLILDERELLKRYLEEVARREDAEVQIELARIELQREVFREYSARWWEAHHAEEYWNAYFEGQAYAEQLLGDSAGLNYCKLITGLLPQAGTGPNPDPILKQAFQRGIVSIVPECFVADLTKALKQLDGEVSVLERQLIRLSQTVLRQSPSRREAENLKDQLSNEFARTMDKVVQEQVASLAAAVEPPSEIMAKVTETARLLSLQMNCGALTDNYGRRLSCDLVRIPSEFPLDRNAAYRILFAGQQLGIYQPTVLVEPILEAAQYYLTAIRPGDAIVTSLLGTLRAHLGRLDQIRQNRMLSAVVDFNRDYARAIRKFQYENSLSARMQISLEVQERVLGDFFTIREKLVTYSRLELGTRLERELLGNILDHYAEALQLALGIGSPETLVLNTGPIETTLSDLDRSRITLIENLPALSRGLLLGRDAEEVAYWGEMLELNLL